MLNLKPSQYASEKQNYVSSCSQRCRIVDFLSLNLSYCSKGLYIKDVRSREVCPVWRTFCGRGFFRCGRLHFLVQKTSDFSKFMICTDIRTRGLSRADVLYGQPLSLIALFQYAIKLHIIVVLFLFY